MLISPTIPPVALVDQNSVNQSLNNQIANAEQSRKATDTVQLSAEAKNLANADLNSSSNRQHIVQNTSASRENEALETAPDNESSESQQPVNNLTQQSTTTKIDVVV